MLKISLFSYLCSIAYLSAYSVETLTLEEKAGQVLMAHFRGEVPNENAKALICDTKVGGVIYYNWSNGLHSPEQVQDLSFGLQKLSQENRLPIPLFIAADQEGGVVTRLKQGFTIFPGNKTIGDTGDPNLAEAVAFAIGEELQGVGININLAPVVDVNINRLNSVIGIRSFGSDPETVVAFGEKALNGYKQANIIATLKHFPGHGDVKIDSHKDLPTIHKSIEELEQVELLPFAKLASSADMIMTAHLLVPALDQENCSTLSEKTLTYLRDTIGFKGVIITDSLVMKGVLKQCPTVDEAAIQALNAGCDMLLLGGRQLVNSQANFELAVRDIQRIYYAIVNAVRSNCISEERLNQAVEKILKLKERYLEGKNFESRPGLLLLVNTPGHRELAQKVVSLAPKIPSLTVSPENANKIGERIWKNECAGTIEGLTNWKKGENFPSLGIGHFIWYPAGKKELFQETFPELLIFLQKEGAVLPEWLKTAPGCPWNSRDEFYKEIQSHKMKSLRQFLFDTRNLQAIFMAKRLEEVLSLMLQNCSQPEQERISTLFSRLAHDPNGLYALLDYLNFKGSGISSNESYNGEGWGLMQVLQSIPSTSEQPLADFVKAAKSLLKQRVENSPPERHEEQWLKGWFNRLDTYLSPI